ncbi:MAG: tRNA pseudouridine(55) synthase TruB [Planctomycetota bacterium]|jgi:tRNA pseudouridine55 synthase
MGRANKHPEAVIDGVLVVDKPAGFTSMDAVALVRGKAGGVKTGHAGTLDPLATGVLVVALGAATRKLARFMATDKRYRTVVDLSAFTSTDDLEGSREEVEVAAVPSEQDVRAAISGFVGEIVQRPPTHSAVKVGGRRAYALSRRGREPDLPPRTVIVHGIDLVRYAWPLVEIDLRCGKGFYVRSLARDLGRALGTGGHCHSLRRTAVGPFTESESVRLDDVPEPLDQSHLISVDEALARLEAAGQADSG